MRQRRVLITYGWCRTAYAAARSLSRAGFRVYVCDCSSLNMTRFSRFASGFDRVPNPFRKPSDYAEAVADIARRRHIDVILPVHEDALALRTHSDLLPGDVLLACPPLSALLPALDKAEVTRVAQSAGVACPATYAPGTLEDACAHLSGASFPLVIKTRRGNSGKGVFVARSPADAERTYRSVVKRFSLEGGHLPLLQEFVPGGLYGSCFLARDGALVECFCERYLRCKGGGFGTSVLREPCTDPRLRQATERMAAALSWTGIGHFDFIIDERASRVVFVEMNPRLWGALDMALQNGFDFPAALIAMLLGNEAGSFFSPAPKPTASLWIVGELIAGMTELRQGRLLAPLASLRRILLPGMRCAYDDFHWRDPLPLLAELLYYGAQFVLSGGNPNPEKAEMMR